MGRRSYQLGKRQASVDQTRDSILRAARDEVVAGAGVSLARVAEKAGVSRITVYNQFGSKAGLLQAIRPPAPPHAAGLWNPDLMVVLAVRPLRPINGEEHHNEV